MHVNNNTILQHNLILSNIEKVADYIMLNKDKNIYKLVELVKFVDVDTLVTFKNRYGYRILDFLVRYKFYNLINTCNNNLCLMPILYRNLKLITHLSIINDKYENHPYKNSFINVLGPNIQKITKFNIDNVFKLFLLTHATKFIGFEKWGPGNCECPRINVTNHYKKHVENPFNPYNENWDNVLKEKTTQAYEMFAIKNSRNMANKMVHTNGKGTYLSGTVENILIIGRLDSNFNLGISSCYIMSEQSQHKKLSIFNNQLCFTFN